MTADDLVTHGARASAAMVLTNFSQNIPTSTTAGSTIIIWHNGIKDRHRRTSPLCAWTRCYCILVQSLSIYMIKPFDMDWCMTTLTPLVMNWRYHSLAQSHQYNMHEPIYLQPWPPLMSTWDNGKWYPYICSQDCYLWVYQIMGNYPAMLYLSWWSPWQWPLALMGIAECC